MYTNEHWSGVTTDLLYGALCSLATGERHEGVAAVGAGHRVHHEAKVPDGPALLEQRN